MNSELKKNLKNLDGLLISSPANIIYLSGYSGFSNIERECFLIITNDSKHIITSKIHSKAVKEKTKNFKVIDSGTYSFLKNEAKELFIKLKIKNLGFEENNLTVSEYSTWRKFAKLKPVNLRNLRIIKSEEEIKNLKLACRVGDAVFKTIVKQIKLGISEKEIANKLEFYIKEKGAETSFTPIVAFGKNSSSPHHQSDQTKLKKNQIILFDFGVKFNNYCSDMSRTVFFGKATEEFKKIHQTVLSAQAKSFSYLKSLIINLPAGKADHKSVTAKQIDNKARKFIIEEGYENMIHSVGHGVGIEVHEAPSISPNSPDKIKNGMIFSIEPGIYKSGLGGVRIEDLVIIQDNNAELITNSNRKLIEL